MSEIQSGLIGFDPLEMSGQGQDPQYILDHKARSDISSILRSYTGYFDVFNELIQNALDAVEKNQRDSLEDFIPRIWISLDLESRRIKVTDNGTGMGEEEVRYFLRPGLSFKRQKEGRGHKGVGASFLAYGFSTIRIQTKKNSNQIAVALRNGRQWAEDQTNSIPRPKFEAEEPFSDELAGLESGTSVEIVLGNEPGVRPKDITWLGATTAETWSDVLRIKTPLGGVYLTEPPFKPLVQLTVRDPHGKISSKQLEGPTYVFPHEIPGFKSKSIRQIEAALRAIQGGPDERFSLLNHDFKRLSCVYDKYTKEEILDEDGPFRSVLNEEQLQLVEKHKVSLYAAFLASAKQWSTFNDETLQLRKGVRLMHGGMQLASDHMVQGELAVIPLTSAIGY